MVLASQSPLEKRRFLQQRLAFKNQEIKLVADVKAAFFRSDYEY
jgi:hypothetical protein